METTKQLLKSLSSNKVKELIKELNHNKGKHEDVIKLDENSIQKIVNIYKDNEEIDVTNVYENIIFYYMKHNS